MSRKTRQASQSGIYHVILRSINQQQLFEDDEDYKKCLYSLADSLKKYSLVIYAYCLMGNHIHILLQSPSKRILSSFFQSFGSKFAFWYNAKYQRYGHLFQDRFKSIVIENNDTFLKVVDYIHQNPVKAQMINAATDYPWSSCSIYYGKRNNILKVDTSFAVSITGSKSNLHSFFAHNRIIKEFENCHEPINTRNSILDSQAKIIIKNISGCKSPHDFQTLPRVLRNKCIIKLFSSGLNINQISRLCGISRTTIYRILQQ